MHRLLQARIMLPGPAPDDAHDLAAFQQRQVERNARYRSGGESNNQVTNMPTYLSQSLFGVSSPHRVIDDIEPTGTRQPLQLRSEFLLQRRSGNIRRIFQSL